jgi:FkbM family methyltransferase
MRELFEKIRLYGLQRSLGYAISETGRVLWNQGVRHSYSQSGEDVAIDKLLNYKSRGFYVDVGANHPTRFSNTKRFYMRGWNGINVEPNVVALERFVAARPRDINLNLGVGIAAGTLKFYRFRPDTLSTFSPPEAQRYMSEGFALEEEVDVPVLPLRAILERHAPEREIDFLSVDTEGFDLEVLSSNDWDRFRPTIVCVETSTLSLRVTAVKDTKPIHEFLTEAGYELLSDNGLNALYRARR